MIEARKTIRIRHEAARRRELVVAEKTLLAPNYLTIRFTCDDFADFVSAGADDHVKLFVPGDYGAGGKPPMRDYTPRAFDIAKGEITIDFAVHDDPGPATAWAVAAQVGDCIGIGGPRGSQVVPDDYDWYWLIGDETAIPAIVRRLAELPDAAITVLAAVDGEAEEVPLPVTASHIVKWVHRPATEAGNSAALLADLAGMPLPAGDGFIWIAAEATVAKALREAVLARGFPPAQLKAAGYWTRGFADTTERLD